MKFFMAEENPLRIWSHLLKKPLMENFIFCTVNSTKTSISVKRWIINKNFKYVVMLMFFGKEIYNQDEDY